MNERLEEAQYEIERARKAIADARQKFTEKVNAILLKASNDADSLAQAVGDVSPDQAFDAWTRNLLDSIAGRPEKKVR